MTLVAYCFLQSLLVKHWVFFTNLVRERIPETWGDVCCCHVFLHTFDVFAPSLLFPFPFEKCWRAMNLTSKPQQWSNYSQDTCLSYFCSKCRKRRGKRRMGKKNEVSKMSVHFDSAPPTHHSVPSVPRVAALDWEPSPVHYGEMRKNLELGATHLQSWEGLHQLVSLTAPDPSLPSLPSHHLDCLLRAEIGSQIGSIMTYNLPESASVPACRVT